MRAVALDANLLLVFVVGRDHPERLGNAKHLKEFMPSDFDLLVSLLSAYDRILVTPNVVTECSDLLGDSDEQEDAKRALKEFVDSALVEERYVMSRSAAAMRQYWYLGVADCSLLDLVDGETVLFTMDARLAIEAMRLNPGSVNFNNLRDFGRRRGSSGKRSGNAGAEI